MSNIVNGEPKSIYESEAVIKNSENFVGMGLWNIGNELKYIRENKTYQQRGVQSFEQYVEECLDYSRSSAYNYISIAENYNVQAIGQIGHLGLTKLAALARLPEPERNDVISSVHEVNGEMKTIDIMSTREVQQLIREKKELERAKDELEQQKKELEEERAGLEADLEVVLNREAYAKQRLKEKDEAIARVINTKTEKVVEKAPEDYERIRQENEKLKEQNKTLLDQKQQVTRQLQETKALYTDIVNLTEFRTSIGSFLDKMAKYTYYAEAFGLLEPRQQTEFHSQVDKIEEWCKEVRQAIKGIKTEKSIVIEGGYRVE